MAVPIWVSAVGHFVSDVVGAMFGIQMAETRKQAADTTAKEIKRVLMPDRKDIMKEILYLGDEVGALRELLEEAEGGFIEVDGRRYPENWIINMLLKVDPIDRGWVFRMLNEVLEVQGRKEFFTHLEILNNDGWLQYLKLMKAVFGESVGKAKRKLRGKLKKLRLSERVPEAAGQLDHWAENTAAPAILQFRMSQKWLKRSKKRQRELEEKWMSRAIRYME